MPSQTEQAFVDAWAERGGGALVRPMEAPFHDWLGLCQWILVAVWFSCVIALAVRVLRTTRGRHGSGHTDVLA